MLGAALKLPNGQIVFADGEVPIEHYKCEGDNKVYVNDYDFKRLWDNMDNNETLFIIISKLKAWPIKIKPYARPRKRNKFNS